MHEDGSCHTWRVRLGDYLAMTGIGWVAQAGLALALVAVTSTAQAGPALVFNADDGHVLYAEDQDDQWHPASLTKIMTAYLAMQAIKSGKLTLETKIKCSEKCNAEPPSKMGLPVGAEISVDTALKTLIVKSANDVAVMLAEGVGGSLEDFVAQMNLTAMRLGMARTKFVNPNGLPADEQVTTARDLAKLSRAVIADFPRFASYWAMADVQLGRRRIVGHNGLLKTVDGADGLKTGFTCDSGYNVVASATRDGHRVMAVVLGERSGAERSIRAQSLLEHGFNTSGWKKLFNTTTLDNLPMATELKTAISVRSLLVSRECGGHGRALVAAKVRKHTKIAKAMAVGAPGAGTAASATAAPATEASTAPKAKVTQKITTATVPSQAAPHGTATSPTAAASSGAAKPTPAVAKPAGQTAGASQAQ